MEIGTPDELAAHAALARSLTMPADGECLLCYVDRMLRTFGCDNTLRWARRWRDLNRPRVTGLERRLRARGGYCDCEVFANVWTLRPDLCLPDDDGEPSWPAESPACAGIGPRSSQPCANWQPWQRAGW